MKKRDFIQTACIAFMPVLDWDVDKSIAYAEKLYARLEAKGYGEPKQNGKHEIKAAYNKLTPVMKAAFDVFWLAFDLKKGKDEAAGSWLVMKEHNKATYDKIIAAAKHTAIERKTLPEGQVAIQAQGWLSKRRWLDAQATPVDEAEKQRRLMKQKSNAASNNKPCKILIRIWPTPRKWPNKLKTHSGMTKRPNSPKNYVNRGMIMINSRKLEDLHPKVAPLCQLFIDDCKAQGIDVIITSTYRDHESQDAIYAQGRTRSGPKITNAKGGQSFHNYRVAFDFVPIVNGKADWNNTKTWRQCGEIAESLGLEWAGRWNSFELCHCQYTQGLSLVEFQAGKRLV